MCAEWIFRSVAAGSAVLKRENSRDSAEGKKYEKRKEKKSQIFRLPNRHGKPTKSQLSQDLRLVSWMKGKFYKFLVWKLVQLEVYNFPIHTPMTRTGRKEKKVHWSEETRGEQQQSAKFTNYIRMFPIFWARFPPATFPSPRPRPNNVRDVSCCRHLVDVASLRGRPELSENIWKKSVKRAREEIISYARCMNSATLHVCWRFVIVHDNEWAQGEKGARMCEANRKGNFQRRINALQGWESIRAYTPALTQTATRLSGCAR